MKRARYKSLEDDPYYGWVQELAGVWAQAATLEECRVELQSVIADWLLLGLKLGQALPGFDDSEELRGLRT